jgi:hypothetical protein
MEGKGFNLITWGYTEVGVGVESRALISQLSFHCTAPKESKSEQA